MTLSTIAITAPTLPDALPVAQQDLMNLFYNHFQALSKQVCENNSNLCEGCDDIFVNPKVEGMLRSPYQSEVAAVMPPKVNAAVILGNHNYQVTNGGWLQYDGNGYSDSVDALRMLYHGADLIGIEGASEMLEMIEQFIERKADDAAPRNPLSGYDDDDDEFDCEDDSFDNFKDLDQRYYAANREPMMQEILNRFEEVTAPAFMIGAYRKAA